MRKLTGCSLTLVFFALLCASALSQLNDSGREGAQVAVRNSPYTRKLLTVLPDGDQPATSGNELVKPRAIGSGSPPDKDISPWRHDLHNPVWKRLATLGLPDRQNALLGLTVPTDSSPLVRQELSSIETLWNHGSYEQAIKTLRDLEESRERVGILVAIGWKTPVPVSKSKWGTDIRIGNRPGVLKTCLDFDDGTGNLFAMLKFYDGEYWATTVNFSSDSGQTWGERHWVWGPNVINDIDATVMHGYFYTGMTVGWNQVVSINRFFASDGAEDYAYGTHNVIDGDYDVMDIALTSNADSYDNRIYLLGILETNSLVYLWSDQDAVTWYPVATGVANADHGLDACCNEDYSEYFLLASYVDVNGYLHVARRSGVGWESILFGDANARTSVAAYHDRIITVFEYNYPDGQGIKYFISYNGGDDWYFGAVAQPSAGQSFHSPDVTGRRGGGIIVVYQEEVGEPDICWCEHRDYDAVNWTTPEQFNEIDVVTGNPMTVEWIPPTPPRCHAYGSIWVGGGEWGAYFDKTVHLLPGDANGDGVVAPGDVVYLINYLFRSGPPPNPMGAGDCNCDGAVAPGDVVYLINYFFRNGDPPCCP